MDVKIYHAATGGFGRPKSKVVETHITQAALTMTAILATRDIEALRIEMLKFMIGWQIGKQFQIDPQLKGVDRTLGFWYLSSRTLCVSIL